MTGGTTAAPQIAMTMKLEANSVSCPSFSSPSAKMVGNMIDMKKLVATSAQMLGKPPSVAARQHSTILQPA